MTNHPTTCSTTTTAKAGRPLAVHQGGEIGQRNTQGGGEGGERHPTRKGGARFPRVPAANRNTGSSSGGRHG